jgi:hypothetical protein
MSDRRREARVGARRTVLVGCETWGEFFSRYAGDVAAGGMFILADGNDLPGVGERFVLRLGLPEGHEITLEAIVAHVVRPEGAEQEHVSAGVGVEFVGMSPETQSAIHRLVEFSRQRGHERSVSTSYAGWLFDYAVPVRLNEIVETLTEQRRDCEVPSTLDGADAEPPSAEPVEPSQELKARLELQLSAALQHLAHKRTQEASAVLKEILAQDPSQATARKWTFVLNARDMIEASRDAMAAVYYKKVLEIDAQDLEAKKYVEAHEKNKRLEALPFGHLFVKRAK